ncbi:MAG: aspartate aminotransferase family protein [Campylobacterales bacterium]
MNNDMNIFTQYESEIRAYCRAAPTVFKSSVNAKLKDENNKEYIDFFAGAGVLNFGHNNPKMKEAMIEFIQNDGVGHSLDMFTDVKREFIKSFVETILEPRGMKYKLQFTGPTGTNAVEAALKLARKFTKRDDIVAFTKAFHGMTLGALACTANEHFRGAAGVSLDNIQRAPFGCETPCINCHLGCGIEVIGKLRARYEDPASGVRPPAAFIVETIQAEGGVRVASKEWLQELQKLARDVGALFIIDDIQAGCGRTGSYFSFDGFGLDPDIVILAKGIGGYGTPLAMTLNKPEIDRVWSPGEHTGTFRGQGLSFVAGKVGLEYFKDDALNKEVAQKGSMIKEFLEKLRDDRSSMQVRGRGMMVALDVGEGALSKEIAKECFENGLLIGVCSGKGEVLKFIPPLTIEEDTLQKGLDIFANVFKKVVGS